MLCTLHCLLRTMKDDASKRCIGPSCSMASDSITKDYCGLKQLKQVKHVDSVDMSVAFGSFLRPAHQMLLPPAQANILASAGPAPLWLLAACNLGVFLHVLASFQVSGATQSVYGGRRLFVGSSNPSRPGSAHICCVHTAHCPLPCPAAVQPTAHAHPRVLAGGHGESLHGCQRRHSRRHGARAGRPAG